ncbi:hypothetical protein ScPMuIL_002485 [Solemya velum]
MFAPNSKTNCFGIPMYGELQKQVCCNMSREQIPYRRAIVVVTSWGKTHKLSVHMLEMCGDVATDSDVPQPPPRKQPRIDNYIDGVAKDANLKLMSTAYKLAIKALSFRT